MLHVCCSHKWILRRLPCPTEPAWEGSHITTSMYSPVFLLTNQSTSVSLSAIITKPPSINKNSQTPPYPLSVTDKTDFYWLAHNQAQIFKSLKIFKQDSFWCGLQCCRLESSRSLERMSLYVGGGTQAVNNLLNVLGVFRYSRSKATSTIIHNPLVGHSPLELPYPASSSLSRKRNEKRSSDHRRPSSFLLLKAMPFVTGSDARSYVRSVFATSSSALVTSDALCC